MKFTPFQLMAIATVSFGSIVLLNIMAQYRSSEEFRQYLTSIKATDLIPQRARRVAEENMEAEEITVPDDGDDDDEEE